MNYFLILLLFLLDLLLANTFNCFLIQSLLVVTLFNITNSTMTRDIIFASSLISLQTFLELNELFFAPIALLLLIQLFPKIKDHFNIKPLAIVTMLGIFDFTKFVISALYGAQASILFTSCQFFVNISLLIAILILLEFKGRLGNRYYRW
jgi:hypothetical protein